MRVPQNLSFLAARGRHTASTLSPHSINDRTLTAAARCEMPESCPMYPTHDASHRASSGNATLCISLIRVAGSASASRLNRSRSASPPTSIRFSVVADITYCSNSRHLLSGQFFLSLPLPGCTATHFPEMIVVSNAFSISNRGTASASKIASCSSGFRKASDACAPASSSGRCSPGDELRPCATSHVGFEKPVRVVEKRDDQVEFRKIIFEALLQLAIPRKKNCHGSRLDGLHALGQSRRQRELRDVRITQNLQMRPGKLLPQRRQHRHRQDKITDRAATNY